MSDTPERLVRYRVVRVTEGQPTACLELVQEDATSPGDPGGIHWVGDVWYRACPARSV